MNSGVSAGLISDVDGLGGQKDRDERVFSALIEVGPSVNTALFGHLFHVEC